MPTVEAFEFFGADAGDAAHVHAIRLWYEVEELGRAVVVEQVPRIRDTPLEQVGDGSGAAERCEAVGTREPQSRFNLAARQLTVLEPSHAIQPRLHVWRCLV